MCSVLVFAFVIFIAYAMGENATQVQPKCSLDSTSTIKLQAKAIMLQAKNLMSKGILEDDPNNLSLFCFAWTPRRTEDDVMLPEVRKQYTACDGYAFFSDQALDNETDFVKVAVPLQSTPREDSKWLYHKNMIGLIPSWKHLLDSRVDEQYDWIINAELDHFMRPSKVRLGIASYLRTLQNGSEDKQYLEKPMMLMWGNAFVFNRQMVQEMRKQWASLGKVRKDGCPEWSERCEQDMAYPIMAQNVMNPSISAFGSSGCGQFSHSPLGEQFQLACWEMYQNPDGMSESGQLAAIRNIADGLSVLDSGNQWVSVFDVGNQWDLFYPDKEVALIHHVAFPSVQALGRKMLGL